MGEPNNIHRRSPSHATPYDLDESNLQTPKENVSPIKANQMMSILNPVESEEDYTNKSNLEAFMFYGNYKSQSQMLIED